MKTFQETLYAHHAQVLTVDREVYQGRTRLQDVRVFENRVFGRVLALDGFVQLTDADNHIYHEMIAHVPLLTHDAPRRVLIIGGGDGGTLKEVLKHPVEQVVMVEIDREVIELSKRFFPQVSDGAFEDARVELVIGDGVRYVAEAMAAGFDSVIIDSTDPVGPGEQLFTRTFYDRCRALLRTGGTLALQSGAPFCSPGQLADVCVRIAGAFEDVRPYLAPVPSYAGGMPALVAAGTNDSVLQPAIQTLDARCQRIGLRTRYYTPQIHGAAFTMAAGFAAAPSPAARNFSVASSR